MDSDLLANYARGGFEPSYEPSYDLDIVGKGVDIHLKGKGLNAERDYHNYEDDEILGRYYIDCPVYNRRANLCVYFDGNDGRCIYLMKGDYVFSYDPSIVCTDGVIGE